MPTHALALPALLLATLSLQVPAIARSADDDGMRLEVERVELHARRTFPGPAGFKHAAGIQGVAIQPYFKLTAPYPAPFINREARVLYTRTLDQSDFALQSPGGKPIDGVLYPQGPAYFVSLSAPKPAQIVGSDITVPTGAPYVHLSALPRTIARLDGELHLDVADDLTSSEFPAPSEPKLVSLAPGVNLKLEPVPLQVSAQCELRTLLTIDEAKRTPGPADIRLPFVNRIDTNRSKYGGIVFNSFPRSVEAVPNGVLSFHCSTPESPVTLNVQLIKSVHTAKVPFSVTGINLPLSPASPPSTAPARLVSESDDFEIRLLSAHAKASWRPGSSAQSGVNLILTLGVRDSRGDRMTDSARVISVDAITDADGSDLLASTPRRSSPREASSVVGTGHFVPRPASSSPRRGPDLSGYSSTTTVPITAIPTRIASIRGSVTFEEVTRDRIFIFKPANVQTCTLLGTNIHLVEWSRLTEPKLRGRIPTNDWLQLISRYQPDRSKSGRRMPCVNMIEFLDSTGTPLATPRSPITVDFDAGIIYEVGIPFDEAGASAIRAHIVYETRTRTIPFEFANVPIGSTQ